MFGGLPARPHRGLCYLWIVLLRHYVSNLVWHTPNVGEKKENGVESRQLSANAKSFDVLALVGSDIVGLSVRDAIFSTC